MYEPVTVYRYSVGNHRWRFTTRWSKKAQITGQFERMYDPMTGEAMDDYTYWGDGSWPQPSYYQVIMMRPQGR